MRNLIFKWLKIPPEPALPAGSQGSAKTFRADRNFYYVLLAKWGIKQVWVWVGIIFALIWVIPVTRDLPAHLSGLIKILEAVGIAGVLFQMGFTLYLVRLDYELRWYIVTDRSIRIRAGVWDIREMTMTFANIQHASVSQGPLQRMLGISDVQVRTAGGGSGMDSSDQHQKGAGEMMHVAYFRGVNNAEEIKELIQERMRRYSDAGLGDPDEADEIEGLAAETGPTGELLVAAREFASEASKLNRALPIPGLRH